VPALTLTVLDQALAVVRLEPDARVPGWLPTSGFTTVTRSDDELSIVCASAAVPDGLGLTAEAGWLAMKLEGPFEFTLTGILAAVLNPLADEGVGIFAISTYDTDYVLVKAGQLARASSALRASGHTVHD